MDRPEAVTLARTMRARGITREWTITVSETIHGKWRVVISTPAGEQALAIYQARILSKPVEVAS